MVRSAKDLHRLRSLQCGNNIDEGKSKKENEGTTIWEKAAIHDLEVTEVSGGDDEQESGGHSSSPTL